MEYKTLKETAERWGITARMVNHYCVAGRIEGAVRFNGVWAIPKEAAKPKDGRLSKQPVDRTQSGLLSLFEAEKETVFAQAIELFPYAIGIFASDGTLVYGNLSYFKFFHLPDKSKLLGKMNLLRDEVTKNAGFAEFAERALKGETIRIEDRKAPIQDVVDRHGNGLPLPVTLYGSVTSFPIWNENKELAYTVALIVPTREYSGRGEIVKAQEYIENHWAEKFSIHAIAGEVGLSRAQFSKNFREFTGITPFDYYIKVKIGHLKEKLLDSNLSVSQAFCDCGIDYNGYSAKIFKNHVGMTPLQYRKNQK